MNQLRLFQLRKTTTFLAFSATVSLMLPQVSTANSFDNEWKAFQQAEQTSFSNYLSEHDRQFVSFLEQHWEEFDMFQGKVRDTTPKPAKAPAVKNLLQSTGQQQSIKKVESSTRPTLDSNYFFGHDIILARLAVADFPDLSKPSNTVLAAAWKAMAEVNNQKAINQIKRDIGELELGDWGAYLYVKFLVEKQIADETERKTYLWFLLSKLGYDVKVSFSKRDIHLMLPSEQTIYGKTFIQISGKTYYLVQPTNYKGALYSYSGSYDRSSRNFEMNFNKVLSGSTNTLSRMISYTESNNTVELNLNYDEGYSHILNAYPQIDLQYYFSAIPNKTLVDSLRKQLQPKLANLSHREAIDYLLKLLQTGFTYALDQDQFGEENYLLGEESLFYSANDCEDRSILLAWLIKDLLDLDVVGLDFPGHIAIAVALKPQEADWVIASEGARYVIADPTYIGATTGMIMPAYKSSIPQVIKF